jgi:MinD superfamily P-loop ATPase
MNIAILSGKGGTGKTLCAVNFAALNPDSTYVDCDVEEPNGYLYFPLQNPHQEFIHTFLPKIDNTRCNGCRVCVDFCRFGALAYANNQVLVFPELCHACGGCLLACPQKAILETHQRIGEIIEGQSRNVHVIGGNLIPGQESGIPIIKQILRHIDQKQGLVFIDCPPGSSCAAMECIQKADYCLLIAEPTILGAHDLEMVVDLIKLARRKFGVVLNKSTAAEDPSSTYCLRQGIPILGTIPYDGELGKINSEARIAVDELPHIRMLMTRILERLLVEVGNETAIDPQR